MVGRPAGLSVVEYPHETIRPMGTYPPLLAGDALLTLYGDLAGTAIFAAALYFFLRRLSGSAAAISAER